MADNKDKIMFNDNMKTKPGSKNKDYLCFSNQYVCNITADEKQYNHVEGFYYSSMYATIDHKRAERIRNVLFPGLCKKIANECPLTHEELNKWNKRRVLIMKRAIFIKFMTNSELAKSLISTGDAPLVYSSDNDSYWGNGPDSKGENILGKILEEVRDVLIDLPNVESDDE